MFAMAFDMVVSDLKKNYGEPYNNAYFAIGLILRKYGFYNAQGSVYLTERNDMANLYRAIEAQFWQVRVSAIRCYLSFCISTANPV